MSDTTLAGPGGRVRAPASSSLYRAVWRWHFYAGLFVLPFLIALAVTGALYLFRDELDAIVHADLKRVEIAEQAATLSPSALVSAALAAHPGTAVKYTGPARPDASAEVTVKTEAGQKLDVYVDPYRGTVLGALPYRGTVMWTVRHLHSLRYFGPVTRALIEIAAGWTILLVGTGLYLWWPRGRTGGAVSIRGRPRQRVFWRDIHAVAGLVVGFFVVFLAVTGMPWSGVWGAKVNEWANGSNFGYPTGVRVDIPMSNQRLDDVSKTSWSLEQAKLPTSAPGTDPIGLDRAAAILDRLGMQRGYTIALPTARTGVYSASVYPDDLARQRVVHLDQYSGEPLIDMGYDDYGPMGRALEWGINVHLGQEFGLANQLVLLVACAGMVLVSVSAAVMWWKRRPRGGLGVPPLPADMRVFRGLIAIMAAVGIVFPLVGLTLIAMLIVDLAVARRQRRARPA